MVTRSLEVRREIARQRQTQLLPWIANPFTKHEQEHVAAHPEETGYAPAKEANSSGHSESDAALERTAEKLAEVEEIEEATPIELFYDLFFVANLTTVTSVHYITEWRTLSSYILFFIILWFTWLHVTLLDVRFSVDSAYERTCKTIHFAVMACFSSVSTTWDPFSPEEKTTAKALKTMTLTLMFSRIILGIQYFVVMGFGWSISKKKVVVPLALHGTVMMLSAAMYLGLYYTFGPKQTRKSYVAWYILAFFEVAAILGTSCTWRVVSFKKTHLVERMGLLTLIIFGEGIIVILKGINTIVKGFGWTKTMVGVIVCGLLVVYFHWMFYFDYNPKNVHYGSIRQQIWALLHFPYHLSIVLSVEGLRQLATLYNFNLTVRRIDADLLAVYSLPINESAIFMDYFNYFYADGGSKTVLKEIANITATVEMLEVATVQSDEYYTVWNDLLVRLYIVLAEYYGIHTPHAKVGALPLSDNGQLYKIVGVFDLVYQYFFISLGVVFFMYGIFAIIVRRHMDVFDYVSIGLRFIVAIIFASMVGLYLNSASAEAYSDYITSAWPIPQVCLMMFTVLIVDKTMSYFALRRARYRLQY